jgi:hypothetical protein
MVLRNIGIVSQHYTGSQHTGTRTEIILTLEVYVLLTEKCFLNKFDVQGDKLKLIHNSIFRDEILHGDPETV